jgi:hypothetical protein
LKGWTGGICRLGIELRNRVVQGADGVRQQGRQQRDARQRECGADLRSRRPKHAETLHAREPGDPVAAREQLAGRREKAMSHKSLTHDGGQSSDCIVPTKCSNKDEESWAEGIEGRRSAKEISEHWADAGHRARQHRLPQSFGSACGTREGRTRLISKAGTVCVSSASTGLCGGSGQSLSLPRPASRLVSMLLEFPCVPSASIGTLDCMMHYPKQARKSLDAARTSARGTSAYGILIVG